MENKELMLDAINGWKDCQVGGNNIMILKAKVKAAKSTIKKWLLMNKKRDLTIDQLEECLEELDKHAATEGWFENLRKTRVSIMSELWRSIRREEQTWRQKSRVKWLNEGDKNTHFFHLMASDRRRRNFIGNFSFNGVVLSDPQSIRQEVFDFFRKKFVSVSWTGPKVEDLQLKRLSTYESRSLDEACSSEEVWEAIKGCEGNKAPGPNGLNLDFFKANWEAIKGDFMNFIHEFHSKGSIVKEINHTFIALIPKIRNPPSLGDFRPISLVGAVYKVLAKVLANRF
ncbi:hypothetical protein Dsin_028322 [Dipteronia sinensis]|uniref:Reverse transcriptase domain-containing protein n=1 Tax=Dipteronia sinensis TaxID=43782 RepID=A0AAD9ZRU2_9ROSI|nr:hypothetical protein Dsin_028322 [Dipteronia sinensis]